MLSRRFAPCRGIHHDVRAHLSLDRRAGFWSRGTYVFCTFVATHIKSLPLRLFATLCE